MPLDSWVYRELDRLRAAGLLESGTAGFRPRSRAEITRLLHEARRLSEEKKETRFEAGLARLEREFATELDDDETAREIGWYFRPIEKVRVSYAWLEDGGDVQNDRGREYREGSGPRLSVSSRAAWGPFSGFLQWEGRHLEGDADALNPREEDDLTAGRVEEGYLRVSLGKWYLEAGRESVWWGPARHGSLLLSDNARPFDLVRFGNDEPFLLPGPLSRLGPVSFEAFLTRLEEDRAVSEPWLAGARLAISPFPWLELGASRTLMIGGEDRPITWTTFRDAVTGHDENEPDGAGNQLASVDWRLTVPWSVQPFEIYGEFGGEDEAGGIFSRFAYIAGIYLPRLGPSALFDLRVEFANTYADGHGNVPEVWYTHGIYTSGYTYEGRIIGHHAGTDARDLYAELGIYPLPALRLWAAYDWEERVVSLDEPEIRTEYGLGVEWTPHERLTVEAAFVHESVDDALVPEEPEEGDRFKLAVTWKF